MAGLLAVSNLHDAYADSHRISCNHHNPGSNPRIHIEFGNIRAWCGEGYQNGNGSPSSLKVFLWFSSYVCSSPAHTSSIIFDQ